MGKVDYTRIDLFNTLVRAEDDEQTFEDWHSSLCTEVEVLQHRSYLLLEFYSAFRKLYNFFFASGIDTADAKIRQFYCLFNKDGTEMTVKVKYKNIHDIDPSFFDVLGTFFDVDPGDNYDDFEIKPPCDDHKSTLWLIFYKQG